MLVGAKIKDQQGLMKDRVREGERYSEKESERIYNERRSEREGERDDVV